MHDKNNNKTQTFIQGLRPFSSSIPIDILFKLSIPFQGILFAFDQIHLFKSPLYPVYLELEKSTYVFGVDRYNGITSNNADKSNFLHPILTLYTSAKVKFKNIVDFKKNKKRIIKILFI